MRAATLPPSVVTRITLADDTVIELNDQNRIIGLNNHRHYLISMEVKDIDTLHAGSYLPITKGQHHGRYELSPIKTIERL